jgi:hypothetical protein
MIAMPPQTAIKALQHHGCGPRAMAARRGGDRKTVRK